MMVGKRWASDCAQCPMDDDHAHAGAEWAKHRVTDRLGGRKLGPIRNNGGFCAAGENFSKNDQDQ